MLELTALVVTAVAETCERYGAQFGGELDLTWRHYDGDPATLWLLEVRLASSPWLERASMVALMDFPERVAGFASVY
ncbi:MAG TPA: hypothetical protein VE991_05850 [Acidimicrobiales bacterium]|nr:hypothetical protein [Acidimicrobiales bacterium]